MMKTRFIAIIAPEASAEGACIFSRFGYYRSFVMGYYGSFVIGYYRSYVMGYYVCVYDGLLSCMVYDPYEHVPISYRPPWSWAHCKCAGLGSRSVWILEIFCAVFLRLYIPQTLRSLSDASIFRNGQRRRCEVFRMTWHDAARFFKPPTYVP